MANLLKEFNDEVHINIPAIPVLSPKHRFVRRLWLPPITVITIASIDNVGRCIILLAHDPGHTCIES
jgi:hypothetical protein